MRRMLTNTIWGVLGPLVLAAKKSPVGAKPERDDREFLEAVLYRARTGIPWRDLPADFGAWNGVYQRFKRWSVGGKFDRLFASLPTDGEAGEVRRLFVDSTTVRAHQHAAGAKKKEDEAEEGLGRSRGGYSTKIHLSATDEDTAVEVIVTAGQAGDSPQFVPLLESSVERVPEVEEVVADKAYSSFDNRDKVLDGDRSVHIPSKSNETEVWPHDEEAYKERNRVERLFGKLKQFRAVATRYDKLASRFTSVLKLALCFIKARAVAKKPLIVNTP